MMNPPPPKADAKAGKRSIFGLLFNPQLGPAVTPLRDTTRVFVHLVAAVFSIYGLFPKDHPALRDENARLSLAQVIRIAFGNVRFTREGAPQAIIFFAITGMMIFSTVALAFAVMSLFVASAHASPDTSVFTAPSTDLAQGWLTYLFGQNGTAPTATATTSSGDTVSLVDPFSGNTALQTALQTALAIYSNAILIVAAIILFYHLAAMVVETAHHGVPMGKRASQIWAPIRLVFAIGLLVPVNGGLSAGQFIVVKMASLGSGLASTVWGSFLNSFANSNQKFPAPPRPADQTQVALNIIRMEACRTAWNQYVAQTTGSISGFANDTMQEPTGKPANIGGVPGTKYSYSSSTLNGTDICGWFFIPSSPSNSYIQAAAAAQGQAISGSLPTLSKYANDKMTALLGVNPSAPGPVDPTADTDLLSDIGGYQSNLNNQITLLSYSDQGAASASTAFDQMKQYGWVMAGTMLNAVDRVQAALTNSAQETIIKSEAPKSVAPSDDQMPTSSGSTAWMDDSGASTMMEMADQKKAWDARKRVAADVGMFNAYLGKVLVSANPGNDANSQCAAMVGLNVSDSGGIASSGANWVFSEVDKIASQNGVWSSGGATGNCGLPGSTGQGFSLGVQFQGGSVFAQMAALGHANLNTAFWFIGGGTIANIFSGLPYVGPAAGMIGGFLFFIGIVFFTCGFTLAFLVPLMPFLRFFFAVLSWFAAVVEAVVAVPLVALAHLNPEGEGLPGQSARQAYFFVFNLFLRPVMTVFGLIVGLIIFLVAVSFLNFSYGAAVAGTGGAAYGQEALARLIYSILYVVMVYICANHSFQLIDHLPQHALSWMGAGGQAMPNMGNVDKIEAIGTGLAAYAGERTFGQINQGAQQFSSGVLKPGSQKAFSKYSQNKERRNNETPEPGTGLTRGQLKEANQFAQSNNMSIRDALNDPQVMKNMGHASGMLTGPEKDAAEEASVRLGLHKPK